MATLEENVASILSTVNTVNSRVNTTNSYLNELRGATPDIREVVTDIKIEPIYVGDRDERRAISAKTIKELLDEGYRPYMFMGISEDQARYAFAKYTGINAAKK